MCKPLRNKTKDWIADGRNSTIAKIKNDVKSAVKFYQKYRYDKELLMKERTEVILIWLHLHKEKDFKSQQELDDDYNNWLFDYCFGDVTECGVDR